MRIYPAIDLRGGQCVRLQQGDYSRETVFDPDPAAVAGRFVSAGADYLHLVDLDGAKAGHPVNGDAVRRILAAGVPCQLGGGIREESHLDEILSWGVARVILGTRAVREPAWAERMARKHPGRVVLGIDARDGKVATEGWLQGTDTLALDFVKAVADWPLAAIVHTDIARDGMLAGPNWQATAELARAVPHLSVIASGGVTSLEDVASCSRAGLHGAIVGRALYEGRLDLASAIAHARSSLSHT